MTSSTGPPARLAVDIPPAAPWTRSRFLLGDWNWLVRDPLDAMRFAFLAGTVAWAILGRDTALGLTAASALLLISRLIDLPRRFDLNVIFAMTLIAWGTALGMYGRHDFYDNIVHGVSPFCYAPVLYIGLVRLGVLADPEETSGAHNHAGVFISTLAIGMAIGAGYEIVEWLSDTLAGTHFVKSVDDTGSDLLEDTVGSLAGALFVTAWSIRNWSTRRSPSPYPAALPARLRAEGVAFRFWPTLASFVMRSRAGDAKAMVVLILRGAIPFLLGAVLLLSPEAELPDVGTVLGLAAGALGLVELATARACMSRLARCQRLVTGGVAIALALVLLAWPSISLQAVLYVIGVAALAVALVQVALLSTGTGSPRERLWRGGAAVTTFIFGIVLLAIPAHSAHAVTLVVGAYALVIGIGRLMHAWRVHQAPAPV